MKDASEEKRREALLDKLCGCSWLMNLPGRGVVVERDRATMRRLLAEYAAEVWEEAAKVCEEHAALLRADPQYVRSPLIVAAEMECGLLADKLRARAPRKETNDVQS